MALVIVELSNSEGKSDLVLARIIAEHLPKFTLYWSFAFTAI